MYETYNEESFETARTLTDFVRERRGFTVPVIIVANKADFEVYDNRKREEKTKVSTRQSFIMLGDILFLPWSSVRLSARH